MTKLAALVILGASIASAHAATVGWLGDGTSYYPGSKAPLNWDLEKKTNIGWRTDLGTRSHSGVIVVGDRLFTQADPYSLVCCDAKTGKEIWRKSYSMLDLLPDAERKPWDEVLHKATQHYDHAKNNPEYPGKELNKNTICKVGMKIDGNLDCYTFTRATPASDGTVVVARNQCGGFACFDLDGKPLWSQPAIGLSSSPVIVDDRVVMAHHGLANGKVPNAKYAKGGVRLSAFELRSGKPLWDCPISYKDDCVNGTVQPMTLASGRKVLATSGGQIIDLKTGENLLTILGPTKKAGNYAGHTVLGSPGVVGDILVLEPEITQELHDSVQGVKWLGSYPGKNDPYSMYAGYRVEEKGGKVTATELWKVAQIHAYDATYSSCAVFDGKVLFLNKSGHIRIFDPATGDCDYRVSPDGPEVRKRRRFVKAPGHGMWVAPSVTASGFYFFNRHGEWATYDRDLKPVATGKLMLMAGAPTFDGLSMYVRTGTELICIRQ